MRNYRKMVNEGFKKWPKFGNQVTFARLLEFNLLFLTNIGVSFTLRYDMKEVDII